MPRLAPLPEQAGSVSAALMTPKMYQQGDPMKVPLLLGMPSVAEDICRTCEPLLPLRGLPCHPMLPAIACRAALRCSIIRSTSSAPVRCVFHSDTDLLADTFELTACSKVQQGRITRIVCKTITAMSMLCMSIWTLICLGGCYRSKQN